jgi:hypothetical protein
VKRFKAVTALECDHPVRDLPGQGKWELEIRKIGVRGAAANQRYWEQPSDKIARYGGACTTNLVVLRAPIFIDASGRAIVPRTPMDSCNHPLGWPSGGPPVAIKWRVASVHKIRRVITLPTPEAHCAPSWGTEFPTAAAGDSAGGTMFPGAPQTVQVCVYRTSGEGQEVGNLVRESWLDRQKTARLFHALKRPGPTKPCPVQRTFAWVIAPRNDQAVEVELGGCYRVARYLEWPGAGSGDPSVIRSLLG